jgi:hypothetical protein
MALPPLVRRVTVGVHKHNGRCAIQHRTRPWALAQVRLVSACTTSP